VAEYVIAQMLRLSRRLDGVDALLRDPSKGWTVARALANDGRDLSGSTMGIIGAGAIGEALARIAAAGFGVNVLGYRRQLDRVAPPMHPMPLDALLEQSDWIVLTCPLTDETRGLIGAAQFARMKPQSVLVNVSRGPVVDDASLVHALASRQIAGAILDVHAVQPLPLDAPIRRFDNVLLSPHLAGITADSMRRMSTLVVGQVLEMLRGRPPTHFVNPPVWASRRPNRFVTSSTESESA
jgi:D-3-phosphoglycerate dehydrogenase